MLNLWHRTVEGAWKWTGARAWQRTVRRMLANAHQQ